MGELIITIKKNDCKNSCIFINGARAVLSRSTRWPGNKETPETLETVKDLKPPAMITEASQSKD